MSNQTAHSMEEDIALFREIDTADPRRVHVYEALDGSFLVAALTDLEAFTLERLWFTPQTATENYNRLAD